MRFGRELNLTLEHYIGCIQTQISECYTAIGKEKDKIKTKNDMIEGLETLKQNIESKTEIYFVFEYGDGESNDSKQAIADWCFENNIPCLFYYEQYPIAGGASFCCWKIKFTCDAHMSEFRKKWIESNN